MNNNILDLFDKSTDFSKINFDIIIDGNNVAFDNVPDDQRPRFNNIWLAVKYYAEKRLNVRVIADASLRHEIDNKKMFNEALSKKIITQTPAGVQADEYILKLALAYPESKIVSNDTFENWRENKQENRDIKKMCSKNERFIKFKINGVFIEFS